MKFKIRHNGKYVELSAFETNGVLSTGLMEKHELADIVLQFMEVADRSLPHETFQEIVKSFSEDK